MYASGYWLHASEALPMTSISRSKWPLGVFTSLDAGLGLGFEVLAELNMPTIQLHAPRAERRSAALAAGLLEKLERIDVEVTCVFAGFSGESYADIPTVERTVGLVPHATRSARVDELKEICDFAALMGVDSVGLHLGFVPHKPASAEYKEMIDVTRDVCDYCAVKRQAIHLETGQEPADVLETFLESVNRPNLYVNFDPANMILYGCGGPLEALKRVGRFVRSVHCKDAIWSDRPGETWGTEVPLGEGSLDVSEFLYVLNEIGYTGPLTIEREIPQEPERQLAEIGRAANLLNRLIKQMQL
jgi:sugar phosphate isomerase/epimerase